MLVLETCRVRGVRRRERKSGLHRMVSADHYRLAAGALGTPVLLERSRLADQSDELDRNHMFHLGMLAIAVFARWVGADRTFFKRLGLSDLGFAADPSMD